ncbi:MAG: leucine-rich repeat domain-containing protein, partial [Muribaculaceae bacterium]|nr:leucine-rich repeat domain-containing protein [Muribaculaceae bacterium]
TINANDFNFMRDRMKLERLDISQVSITALGSNPANAIPTKAFMSYRSLKQIVLPNNLTTFKNACFGLTGLTSVDIPASVGTWEYNVFANCTSLREVTVRRAAPAWVNWCVFTNTPQAKLTVPVGAKAAYEAKEYWQDFKEIVEGVPEPASTFSVTIAEKKGLKFTSLTDGTVFSKGDTYQFKVETDDSFADYTMKVYCNATQLTPDADGVYTATINSNSLLHVEFQAPLGVTTDATWKLTGEAGGIGLVTSVVNVPFGQNFVVRANAIKVPGGNDAAKFYAIVLTDSKGGIKEFISSIVSNYYSYEAKNITYNFNCKVTESTVQPGNRIRLATSYDKKNWQLVEGDADSIAYSLPAIGNPVVLHQVTMPSSVTGARIEGASSEVVRGMPFTVKASAINPAQRVTIAVNGENKAHKVPNATVSIPAVLEDLDITISVSDADAGDYMVFNIQEGKLAEILQDCPDRVKLIGTMHVSDFDALRANAGTIIDLDLSEVTIRGAAMTGNQIPENAFAPSNSSTLSALKSVILPNGIERIQKNAFARCTQISELTIPAGVNYIGDGAFSACTALRKIIAKPKVAPTCGNLSPFPSGAGNIVLEVPKGSEESYSVGSTWWSLLNLNKPSAEQKDYYWIKVNNDRAKTLSISGSLNNIGIGADDLEVVFELPNVQRSSFKTEYQTHLRPGVPFKVYDNGIDVFANLGAYQYNVGSQYYYPYQHWSMTAGKLGIRFNHSATSGPTMIQNHELEIYFYYAVNFENKAGGEGITAEIVEKPEGCEWKDVPMTYFDLNNRTTIPVLYREGSEMKFQLTNIPDKTEPVVSLMTKVMTVTGKNPVYEEREMTLTGNNGIYTIPALEGDTWIRISGTRSFDEGDVIPAEAISSVKPEDAVAFSELTVSGDMGEEDFEAIRENFSGIETLDLSQL